MKLLRHSYSTNGVRPSAPPAKGYKENEQKAYKITVSEGGVR